MKSVKSMLLVLLSSQSIFAMKMMGLQLLAPTIDGKRHVYSPELGEIIYESLETFEYSKIVKLLDFSNRFDL